jgi:hypothetical protein
MSRNRGDIVDHVRVRLQAETHSQSRVPGPTFVSSSRCNCTASPTTSSFASVISPSSISSSCSSKTDDDLQSRIARVDLQMLRTSTLVSLLPS